MLKKVKIIPGFASLSGSLPKCDLRWIMLHLPTQFHSNWPTNKQTLILWHYLNYLFFQTRDLFLLLQVEPVHRSTAESSGQCVFVCVCVCVCVFVCTHLYVCVYTGVYSHYVLQPSPSLTLLLKPVASRELLLPCHQPISTQDPAPDAMQTVQVWNNKCVHWFQEPQNYKV